MRPGGIRKSGSLPLLTTLRAAAILSRMLSIIGCTPRRLSPPPKIAVRIRVGGGRAVAATLPRPVVLSRIPILLILKALSKVISAVEQLALYKLRALEKSFFNKPIRLLRASSIDN